jgi:seryl-tRNA synthetase
MGADEESAGFARYREHEWSDVRQANWVATRASRPGILRDGKPFWFPPSKKGGFFPMLDINLLRTNPELVKENIRKKFQDEKLVMVDEVVEMDKEYRAAIQQADTLRNQIKVASKQIGMLMGKGQKEEAEKAKEQVAVYKADLEGLAAKEDELQAEIRKRMLVIPNIIDPSVPIGKDDSQNVEIERFGEPVVPDFEIPYHVDIMERLHGIDLDSARRTSGNGFYYLMGDIARLHSAILSYGRDFMIDRGFTYCIPPYMIHGDVVTGVMSFAEMENMMYKIEGEDLYLIGTSEHSMIGKFIGTILDESQLPQTLTSYSPCFRKEVGAHGIEERGVYRIHQFEKQEMIVVCKPEDSPMWFNRLWQNTVDFFRSMDIPVRTLECCSGDLADLKVKSLDVEAWSPRQKKYFEVGSCSNLGDAQARRLKIRVKGDDGRKYFAHTLNNTCVAPPRMLIAFLENNLQADGRIRIPEALRMYMGGKEYIG